MALFYAVSKIVPVWGRKKQAMTRFTVTIGNVDDSTEAITFDGCLAGNNANGLWAWPSKKQGPGGGFDTVKWSLEVTNAVLRALQKAGELGGSSEEAT